MNSETIRRRSVLCKISHSKASNATLTDALDISKVPRQTDLPKGRLRSVSLSHLTFFHILLYFFMIGVWSVDLNIVLHDASSN